MSIIFNLAPNQVVDPVVGQIIDQMCTENDRIHPTGKIYLSDTAQKIKNCVAGYTGFNLLHRIWNTVKSIIGLSDWQLARNAIYVSIVGRNFTIFSNLSATLVSDTLLDALTAANEQNVLVSPILNFEIALNILNDKLMSVFPNGFELGQLAFKNRSITTLRTA